MSGASKRRPVRQLLEAGGFRIDRLETGYMPGLRPLSFTYEGGSHAGGNAPMKERAARLDLDPAGAEHREIPVAEQTR